MPRRKPKLRWKKVYFSLDGMRINYFRASIHSRGKIVWTLLVYPHWPDGECEFHLCHMDMEDAAYWEGGYRNPKLAMLAAEEYLKELVGMIQSILKEPTP